MDIISDVINKVESRVGSGRVLRDEPMKNHTSFRIGGKVRAVFLPSTAEEFGYIAGLCENAGIKYVVMGNGTNILFSDEPKDMVVIKTFDYMDKIELIGNGEIYAQCGALLSKIAVCALNNGLTGFEFAHGIPGSLGGAVVMNAGAYGGEMKDVIKSVDAVTGTYGKESCGFSYRHSRFSDGGDYVLGAVIKLEKGDGREIRARMDDLMNRRRNSQPLNYPSAGSTFKRPQGGYAAELIDRAGLKGYTVGGAQVSEKHAGFVVNKGGATFSDVINIMNDIRSRVLENSGIELEPEVRIIK